MTDFAIPGVLPPRADKWERTLRTSPSGAIDIELFEAPPGALLVHVAVADQANHLWLTPQMKDTVLDRVVRADSQRFYLKLKGGELPPGVYRVFTRAVEASDGRRDLPVSTHTFVVPDTPFTRQVFSSYRALTAEQLSQLLAVDLSAIEGVSDVTCVPADDNYWTFWE